MTKEQLRKFIKDTRGLIRGSSDEKKVRLLKLIKEAKRRCDEQELKEMNLDNEKIGSVADSRYGVAGLAGALKAAGAIHGVQQSVRPNRPENTDYLEEK